MKSVRPFLFDEILLCKPEDNEGNLDARQHAIKDVKEKLEEMLEKAERKQAGQYIFFLFVHNYFENLPFSDI